MKDKDITQKVLEKYNDVFADIPVFDSFKS